MVGAEVDEAVGYAKFPDSFEEGVGGGVPCIALAFTARVALRQWGYYKSGNLIDKHTWLLLGVFRAASVMVKQQDLAPHEQLNRGQA